MNENDFKNLSREEKINMLRGITNGTVKRIGNELVDLGPEGSALIITKDGKEYLGTDYNCELPEGFRENFHGSMIIMPDNGRGEWTPKTESKKTGSRRKK